MCVLLGRRKRVGADDCLVRVTGVVADAGADVVGLLRRCFRKMVKELDVKAIEWFVSHGPSVLLRDGPAPPDDGRWLASSLGQHGHS